MKNNLSGAQKNIFRLLIRLDREIIEPILCGQIECELTKLAKDNGIGTVITPYPKGLDVYDKKLLRPSLIDIYYLIKGIWEYNLELIQLFKSIKPNIVWCDNIRTFFSMFIACKISKVPMIWNVWSEPTGKVAWVLHRLGLVLADTINLEYTDQGKKIFGNLVNRRIFNTKIIPLYTGVTDFESSSGTDIRNELKLSDEHILLVMASSIVPGKGQLDLLIAIETLVKEFPNIHLLIAGETVSGHSQSVNYYNKLERFVKNKKLTNYVHFLGWRSDVRDILDDSDIYVSSSYSESFPDAVREAMSMSKPVVVTDTGGTFELVDIGNNGYLFQPGDTTSLTNYLRKIILDPDLRTYMGKEGKKIIDKNFSTKVYAKKFEIMALNSINIRFDN